MEITIIGVIELLVLLGLFVFGSVQALFVTVLVTMLLGGSAAFVLGQSSVSPAHLALGFLMIRCLVPGGSKLSDLVAAFRENVWLVVFVGYGFFGAILLPHIFAGEMDVTPLRGQVRPRFGSELARILASTPLRFTVQNLTTAIYMLGTLLMALLTHAVLRGKPGGARLVARVGGWIGIIHAVTGILGVAAHGTPVDAVLGFFRNSTYATLDHEYKGFIRMNGVWPEASAFAAFAVTWFAFNFECWLRRLETRYTGPATLLLGIAVVASTSSTAYVGLAMFGMLLALRFLAIPGLIPIDRMGWIIICGLVMIAAGCALLILQPALSAAMTGVLEHMTLEKADSYSGRQRLFWAKQGVEAFFISHGLGIGPGSFRSSSLATAILGSTGIIGCASFMLYLIRSFSPLTISTYRLHGDPDRDCAAACAWALLVFIGVASVSAPSCDPTLTFAVLAGSAIALRHMAGRTDKPQAPLLLTRNADLQLSSGGARLS